MTSLPIGTRKSTMAMAQTNEVIRRIKASTPDVEIPIADMETRGDIDQTSKLAKHGGKGGAFVEGIRAGLRDATIRLAMHSLKDIPGNEETPGVVIGAYLSREGVEDALVLRADHSLDAFLAANGQGFKVGTNSVRRAAQLRRLFPPIEPIHFRGAADTRINKLDNHIGQDLEDGGKTEPADVLIMAKSGLERVDLGNRVSLAFSPDELLPAATQGIVVVECAETDWEARAILARINDRDTEMAALAEREVLWVLNGHCHSPIAAYATIEGKTLSIQAQVFSLDGNELVEGEASGPSSRPREVGRDLGMQLLDKGASRLIEASRI